MLEELHKKVIGIVDLLTNQHVSDSIKLILVEAGTGEGKTTLAKELNKVVKNSLYVNCSINRNGISLDDLQLNIIDEPELSEVDVYSDIKTCVSNGGSCVCFVKNSDDISLINIAANMMVNRKGYMIDKLNY